MRVHPCCRHGDGRIAGKPRGQRLDEARAVLGVVAFEIGDRVRMDAFGRVEVAREQRIGRMDGVRWGVEGRRGVGSIGIVDFTRVRARERVIDELATGGDMDRGQRQPTHLLAASGQQVAAAWRARLVLARLHESRLREIPEALGEHAARQAGLRSQIGEASSVVLVDRQQQPQRPPITHEFQRMAALGTEGHVEPSSWFHAETHRTIVAHAVGGFTPAGGAGVDRVGTMPPSPGPISLRSWAWLVLGATVVFCALIAAFNAVVDPTAQVGSGVLEPVAAGPRDRTAKVELLDREPLPSVVVLGSSRTKKLDPTWLGASDGVNAAVVGGDLFEARVLAAWLVDRARATDGDIPRFVVGIDVEQFRDSSLQGSGFLDVPRLAAVARAQAAGSDGSVGDELDRVERLLLSWQVSKASVASVRARVRSAKQADATGERAESGFTATGVPASDVRWQGPAAAERFARATRGAVERNLAELDSTYGANGSELDPDAVEDLRALVELVHEAGGPPPLLYITPAHSALRTRFATFGRDGRRRGVHALLDDVARGGRAVVIDCELCIDANDTSWIDATHPSPLGARQLAERLRDELTSELRSARS